MAYAVPAKEASSDQRETTNSTFKTPTAPKVGASFYLTFKTNNMPSVKESALEASRTDKAASWSVKSDTSPTPTPAPRES